MGNGYFKEIKDWTNYNDIKEELSHEKQIKGYSEHLQNGLYYVIADCTEIKEDGTIYNTQDSILVLQYHNEYALTFKDYDKIKNNNIDCVYDFDGRLCKHSIDEFLIPIALKSCNIKYIKKCNENFKIWTKYTRGKYMRAELNKYRVLNI